MLRSRSSITSPRDKSSYAYEPLNRLNNAYRWRDLLTNSHFVVFFLLISSVIYLATSSLTGGNLRPDDKNIKVSTWNVASINNNPFEYFIDVEKEFEVAYSQLMSSIQGLLENPGEFDKQLSEVFTPDMVDTLFENMNDLDLPNIDAVKEQWQTVYANKLIVSEFLTDKDLGAKRLVSMPDRVTNTIRNDGSVYYRPTIINCYKELFSSKQEYWSQWVNFMFKEQYTDFIPVKHFKAISKSKYPTITAAESEISQTLEVLIIALFDLVLYEVIEEIFPNNLNEFHFLRKHICENMNENKNTKIIDILKDEYFKQDVIFLQEVSTELIDLFNQDISLRVNYDIHFPGRRSKSDQSSIILVRKNNQFGKLENPVEVSDQVIAVLDKKSLVDDGDFFAIKFEEPKLVLGSFHGDTNGLATIPIVEAFLNYLSFGSHREYSFVFGLDANTYAKPIAGKNQGFLNFIEFLRSISVRSFWDSDKVSLPNVNNYTTYNARTYLQPQLNKAIKRDQILETGDVNPKDFIIFYAKDFMNINFQKDNTGSHIFKEDSVFPSTVFPSDHAIVSTTLIPTK